MHESIKLFEDIINNVWFCNTNIILLLNKKDLFEEKMKANTDFKVCFPEFDGVQSYETCSEYIRERFLEKNKKPSRQIFPHFSCATDTGNIKHIWQSMKSIIVNDALDKSLMIN
jgi:hypothetical protein